MSSDASFFCLTKSGNIVGHNVTRSCFKAFVDIAFGLTLEELGERVSKLNSRYTLQRNYGFTLVKNAILIAMGRLWHNPITHWRCFKLSLLFSWLKLRSVVLIAILSTTQAVGLVEAEPLVTAPTPLASDRKPCAAFSEGQDYITQTLIMQLEGREVPLRVPRPFLEDIWDQQQGFADTGQLFRVEIGTFTPVSRVETGRRNKEDVWNWMTFVISDRIPIEDIAVLSAELGSAVIGGDNTRDLDSYALQPGPFGLVEIRSDAPQPTPSFRTNTYIFRSEDSTLSAVLSCNVPGSVMNPVCQHWFRAAGMDVELDYRRTELPNWQMLQDDVTAFLGCVTKQT